MRVRVGVAVRATATATATARFRARARAKAMVRECLRGHEREGDGHHHEGEVGALVEI